MKFIVCTLIIVLSLAKAASADSHPVETSAVCGKTGNTTLQVLGSGGPIADDARASTAYLIWVDGKSRFLIDTGGGAFLRFGEAGANFKDLDHIGISHFHTDHSTDLVALLKSGYFSERTRSLSISGPTAGGDYPGLESYLDQLLLSGSGAYGYLDGYLDGTEGLIKLVSSEVDSDSIKQQVVYTDAVNEIESPALTVPHGPVPTLAYRNRVADKTIVLSGDHNGDSDAFIEFARGANILVMHMPVPEKISGTGRKLHAPPSIIGKIANFTGADTLVLSHFMARSLRNLDENLNIIRSRFDGEVFAAGDLDCYIL